TLFRLWSKQQDNMLLINEGFLASQLFQQTDTSVALERMSARLKLAAPATKEAEELRKYTDLLEARRYINDRLRSRFQVGDWSVKQSETDKLRTLDAEINAATDHLRAISPDLTNLYLPKPVSITDVQLLLDDEEVLIQYAFVGKFGFVWAITKTQ